MKMKLKAISALALLVTCLAGQAGSQIDPLDLNLIQNGRVVFGRGEMIAGGVSRPVSASGLISQDVFYLDIVSLDDQMLYRCVLRPGVRSLSGSYYAFGQQGAAWSGAVRGSRYL